MFISKKKANLLIGNFNVYAVYDKVSKHYLRLYFNSTDEEFVRLYLPEVILRTPLRDLEVFCIGRFNDVTGEIDHCLKRKVNINCYHFPHSRLSPKGEDVSHEEVEEVITSTKNKLMAENSTVVEDENNNEEVKK